MSKPLNGCYLCSESLKTRPYIQKDKKGRTIIKYYCNAHYPEKQMKGRKKTWLKNQKKLLK